MSDILTSVDYSHTVLLPSTNGIEQVVPVVSEGQICIHPSQTFPGYSVPSEVLGKIGGKRTPESLVMAYRILDGSGTLKEVYSHLGKIAEKGTFVSEQVLEFCRRFPEEVRYKNLFRVKEGGKDLAVVVYLNPDKLIVREEYSLTAPRIFSAKDALLFRISLKITT